MQRPPLRVNQQFYNLVSQAGVPGELITFGNVGLQSERCITVCDGKTDGSGQLVTVDLKTQEVSRRPNKADNVLPHPVKNYTAVRAKAKENPNHTTVHIYNMDSKEKIISSTIPDVVKYWTWVNQKLLGIVGAKSAFHISLEGVTGTNLTVNPEKVTDRDGIMAGVTNPVQVINYSCCPNNKFVFINGLSKKTESDGTFSIGGNIQLTSLAVGKSQFLEGHTCCFGTTKVHDEFTDSVLFAYAEKNKINGKLTISEITPNVDPSRKFKMIVDMIYPDSSEADFPVYMTMQENLGLIFLLTKFGLLFVFEISEGSLILRSKISETHVLTGCNLENSKGCIALTKAGNLINIEVDESAFVDFIKNAPHIKNNINVARKLAMRAGLPGSESFYIENFSRNFLAGQYDEAARIVAKSPATILRNRETIEKFKALPKPDNGPHPILKYFFILLENGKLNDVETKEICSLVLQQNKPQMVAKWVDDNKLHLSEELGDMLRPLDAKTAEKIYTAIGSAKVVQMKIQRGEVDSVLGNARPEELVAQMKTMCISDPMAALNLARALAKSGKLPAHKIAEIFLNANMINELTSFCLDYLPNNQESANWQTLILEMNLKTNPSIAETILQSGKWTYFNKANIAPLCEQKGLYLRALENYQDVKDIKRVLLNNSIMIPPEYIKSYLINTLPAEHVAPVLSDLLKYNRNTKLAVEVAQGVFNKVGVKDMVEVFESVGAYDGVYFFLAPLLDKTKDSKVYHKYIEACIKCGQLPEVEKVIQNCVGFYDPEKVLQTLLNVKLADPKALVILCDKNGYIKEMTRYLWENNFSVFIEMYVLRVNPANSGEVLGCLMDLGVEESYIKQLLNTIGSNCKIESLINEFETRNRLRLLEQWLEQRAVEGNILKEVHDALAKLVIDFDKNPEKFLQEDRFYDVKKIGLYAESRDPHLAFTAYKRDIGTCDDEIIELTNKNNLYRLQAKYLVERQSKDLWAKVLDPQNLHRASVVEQVVSSALPESKNGEEVSTTVQAFIVADMPEELLGLLEKIVLHSNEFSGYKKLQNLLIVTAMRTDKSRVVDYINRLDNYDGAEVVKHALSPEFRLYEEAFIIYKKMKQPIEAIQVLLEKIQSIERATEFAEKTNLPEVWSVLGKAYLDANNFNEAVDAFIKAKDATHYESVIFLNKNVHNYEKLIEYFNMARQQKKEAIIDNEYIYCLAKLNRVADIETFINGSNSADLAKIGDRFYSEGLYEAAKVIFMKLKANAKISSCLVRLGQYSQAIEYAKKANNVKTWKEIVYASVEDKEFKLAAQAGIQVVLTPDHLEEVVQFYELHEASEEMIAILEQAVSNEKNHIGIFTELAALYAKYKESKLFDFVKAYFQKLNVSKLIRVCKKYQLWPEIVYLHSNYKEYDAAVQVMMDHSPSCFSHENFVSNLMKVSNSDLIYKAISFYIEEEPMKLNDLLKQMTLKVDFSKVVAQVKRTGYLPLIIEWLKSVQNQNNQSVNDALNQVYLEMEDYEALRNSILTYDSIDAIGLAKQIEGSNHPEFRRISSLIYRKNKKFKESIELSINDHHYRDAIETAQESKNTEIVEQLLFFFAEHGNKEFFTVMTYTCYELISADVVLEVSWRYGMTDNAMPFMIQLMRDLSTRVEQVQKKHEEREKKEEEKQERDARRPLDLGGIIGGNGFTPMNPLLNPGVPMLMNNSFQPNQGMGFGGPNQTGFMNQPHNPSMGGMGQNFPPFR